MNDTLIAAAWVLSALILFLWILAGRRILLRTARPGANFSRSSRVILIPLWIAAGVAGFWGPALHTVTESNQTDPEGVAVLDRSTLSELRTPFLASTSKSERDQEGRLLRSERRSTFQLPILLLLFLGAFGFMTRRRSESFEERRGLAAVAALSLALGGCADAAGDSRPERIFLPVQWDTLFQIESTLEDSLIFEVTRLAANRGGISVLDGVGPRIARFDWGGELQWYAGARGEGPGELQGPRDVRVDDLGTSWVLDVLNRRISGFDDAGRLEAEVPLQEIPMGLDQFAVAAGGRSFFGVVPEDDGRLELFEFDRNGTVVDASVQVLPGLTRMLSLGLQGWVGSAPGEDGWGYAFSFGDGLLRFNRTTSLGPRSLFPDPIPFPEVAREVTRSGFTRSVTTRIVSRTWGANSAAVSNGTFYTVLPDDTRAYTLLESYDMESGRYLGTVRLPLSVGMLAIHDDHLVVGTNSPHPRLLGLRMKFL